MQLCLSRAEKLYRSNEGWLSDWEWLQQAKHSIAFRLPCMVFEERSATLPAPKAIFTDKDSSWTLQRQIHIA